MTLFPRHDETIQGVSEALHSGQRSCVDVVEDCLSRIQARESDVLAWVLVDTEAAVAAARERDRELASGTSRGPLHGIPIGIKDIVDVAGLPTAAGADPPAVVCAKQDALLVARLRHAGAIILGKTVTTQFACFDPAVTRNPWNTAHTPGGSSAGSAAAVACGMCLGAIGSQTGGSITRPASYCGVSGCKPTFGRVPTHGVVPVAKRLDHVGPIARSVRDLAVLLDAITGHGPSAESMHHSSHDSERMNPSRGSRSDRSGTPISPALDSLPEKAPTVSRLGGFFDEHSDPEALSVFSRALEKLSAAGASFCAPPLDCDFEDILRRHRLIMAAEAAAQHEERFRHSPEDYLPCICSMIEEGLRVRVTDYIDCCRHQAKLQRALDVAWPGCDVLLCPAAPGPAPDRSTTGDPKFNSPWSYLGFPTVSFPIGRSPTRLPLALQLVGRPNCELELFQTALWCEDVLRRSCAEKG